MARNSASYINNFLHPKHIVYFCIAHFNKILTEKKHAENDAAQTRSFYIFSGDKKGKFSNMLRFIKMTFIKYKNLNLIILIYCNAI